VNPAELMRDAPPVSAVREGYELHYGKPTVVQTGDPDLALLAGDRLYALGLEKLAAAGDLDAIAILCETIATCARSHAEGSLEQAQRAWQDAARRLSRRR
jgi:geranylgeranyl pyrophosphate synthase